jgi:hypothetical protein
VCVLVTERVVYYWECLGPTIRESARLSAKCSDSVLLFENFITAYIVLVCLRVLTPNHAHPPKSPEPPSGVVNWTGINKNEMVRKVLTPLFLLRS